jgi:hypothetical protein
MRHIFILTSFPQNVKQFLRRPHWPHRLRWLACGHSNWRLNDEHREYLPILAGSRFYKQLMVVSYDCSEISCCILFLSSVLLKLPSLLRNDLKLQQFLLKTIVPRAQCYEAFNSHNLPMFASSLSYCSWQAFPP